MQIQLTPWYLTSPKRIVAFVLGLITFLSFLFVVYPRISVFPGQPLYPYDPFKTPFIIKNEGYLPINNVHYSLSKEKIYLGKNPTKPQIHDNVYNFGGIIPKLGPGVSSPISIDLSRVFKGLSENINRNPEIYIDYTYQPYLIPFSLTESKRFKTMKKYNGEYVWLEYHDEK